MSTSVSKRLAQGVPVALLVGAVTFFVAAPWVIHALADYGFSWSPSLAQQLAWLVAWLMSLPTSLIVGSAEPPRVLLAVNGAVWGGLLYSGWMLLVSIGQGRRPT